MMFQTTVSPLSLHQLLHLSRVSPSANSFLKDFLQQNYFADRLPSLPSVLVECPGCPMWDMNVWGHSAVPHGHDIRVLSAQTTA